MRFKYLALAVWLTGCTYNPTFGDLTCDQEGATRPGQRCHGGVWLTADTGTNPSDDMGTGGGDVTVNDDMSPSGDLGPPDMSCDAESDTFFCMRLGKNCETVTADDNCGDPRSVDCGTCQADVEMCTDNVCEPVPETDQELCDAAGATCDEIMVEDRTGTMRTVDCGMCTPPMECGVGGTANTCACLNANDPQFCADNGATCGPVTAMDPVCNVVRTVNCGACTLPETCGGGGVDNVCGCSESDAEFCARLARNCGPVTADDACGVVRTVDCGSCTLPETCGGGQMMGICGCTSMDACAAAAAQCGTIDVTGQCANLATANCGGCGLAGTCTATNQCMCNSGYTYDGATCADDNECMLGTDNCDVNATCTNTAGSFTCACNPPYVGDGTMCAMPASPPTIEEVVTDTSGGSTLTTPTMTAVDDDLYVAFVELRTGSRSVSSISGLGLTWSRASEHCDGNQQQVIEIWTARGNAGSNSQITVQLSATPYASVVAIYRISNVPSGGAAGNAIVQNSNGLAGACDSSNAQSGYSFDYTTQYANSLLLTGTAIEEFAHTAGAGWTELDELHRNGLGDRDAGLATMNRVSSQPGPVTVSGTLSNSLNWVTGVFEVRGL